MYGSRAVGTSMAFRRQEQLWAWALASPAMILGTIFIIIPFLMAFGLSFTSQRLISPPNLPTRVLGLDN